MTRARQRVFQLPLLLEIAVRHGRVTSRKGESDLREIYDEIKTYFSLESEYLREKTPSGLPRYENDVLWAKKQLEADGELEIKRNQSWAITKHGTDRLRDAIHKALARGGKAIQLQFALSLDECERPFVLHLLSLLPPNTLAQIVQNNLSLEHVLLDALKSVQSDDLLGFFVSAYVEIRQLLGRWTDSKSSR